MTQVALKPKKLWGNPKVFISANELIIEEKYYQLSQTRGAFVELLPAEVAKPPATQTPKPPVTGWAKVRQILAIIGGVIALLFIVLFVIWWNDGYNYGSGGGSAKKYRLVMISEGGPVIVLEHHNEKKLKEIASTVNQALVARGISPQTAY